MSAESRVDLILRVEGDDHLMRSVGTSECSKGEHWHCRCGVGFVGKGAIQRGRRHVAEEILSVLDEAAVVAS